MSTRGIEIIGGGLAGLSLGIALRRNGVPVTLHEAGEYPRHRVCGEFIAGLAQSTIAQLGLESALSDALHHEEVAWSIESGSVHVQRLPSPALALSRHVLDARLARMFVAAGGELVTRSRITETVNAPGRVFAAGRRRAGDSRWIGLKVHVGRLDLVRDLEMHLGSHCYVGLSRLHAGTVNVCGLFHRRPLQGHGADLLLAYLQAAGLGRLAARIARAEIVEDSFCAVAALGFGRNEDSGDRICVGDAGAMIAPFTGNGMAMAFQSAELALPPLLSFARGESDWARTCRVTRLALRGRFRVRLASARALHPFLLRPWRQRWFNVLGRARLLPFGPLYAALH